MKKLAVAILLAGAALAGSDGKKKKQTADPPPSALDRFVAEAEARSGVSPTTPGSIWTPGSQLADSARDVRASQVDDLLTIVVSENASAVVTGATKTSRVSSTKNSITALAGVTRATGALANLANTSGDTELNGQGTTSRNVTLTTTLTARVTHVLPNGALVIQASKDMNLGGLEKQTITVRGVVRQADILVNNTVQSDQLAQVEIDVNGKGVVGDAIRRPNFLYRLLLGILPF
jgi:flagellar L-ring protein FlgH